MIDFWSMSRGEAVYTHVFDDGTNIHLASGRLYGWIQHNYSTLQPAVAEVTEQRARDWVARNIVSLARVEELLPHRALQPGISCYDPEGDLDLYVDGHHRYVACYIMKRPYMPMWRLYPSQWRPFIVTNHPTMTQRELEALPITKRSY